jgi:hypothetical protein
VNAAERAGFKRNPFSRYTPPQEYICNDAQIERLIATVIATTLQNVEDSKRKVIHVKFQEAANLICDNPKCDYVKDAKGAPLTADNVGEPCPKCGDSLLTQEDFNKTLRFLRNVNRINRWFGPLFGRTKAQTLASKHGNLKVRFVGKKVIHKSEIVRGTP